MQKLTGKQHETMIAVSNAIIHNKPTLGYMEIEWNTSLFDKRSLNGLATRGLIEWLGDGSYFLVTQVGVNWMYENNASKFSETFPKPQTETTTDEPASAYNYDSTLHIKNNHPKHSFNHVYSHTNEYLGLASEQQFVSHAEYDNTVYNDETGQYTRQSSYGNPTVVYANVYTQNRVIAGVIKIS